MYTETGAEGVGEGSKWICEGAAGVDAGPVGVGER